MSVQVGLDHGDELLIGDTFGAADRSVDVLSEHAANKRCHAAVDQSNQARR